MNKQQFKSFLKNNNQLNVFIILFKKLGISYREFKKDSKRIFNYGVCDSLIHEVQYNKPLTKEQRRILFNYCTYQRNERNISLNSKGENMLLSRCYEMYLLVDGKDRGVLLEIIDAELIEDSLHWLAGDYLYLVYGGEFKRG